MDRKKLMYIGLILILTVIVSVTYFSYAFFTNTSEQHGKLNVVVGTLNYKIESEDLTNNAITVAANTKKVLTIRITSLNEINSKYELYYATTSNDITVGYSSDTTDQPIGTINSKQSKTIKVVIKNNTNSSATITFGVQGGFTNKTLTLAQGVSVNTQLNMCDYSAGDVVKAVEYTGNIEPYTIPCDGIYRLEVWGAQGGGNTSYTGGYGAYATGNLALNENSHLYIAVGGQGQWSTTKNQLLNETYNGGGSAHGGWSSSNTYHYHGSGGGSTHIAIKLEGNGELFNYETHKNEIVLVASGGGGGGYHSEVAAAFSGGYGGGKIGTLGAYSASSYILNYYGAYTAATQNSPSSIIYNGIASTGSFGKGSNGFVGGGSGWYGGAGSYGRSSSGSSYIGYNTLTNAGMYCYECEEDLLNSSTFTVKTNGSSSYRNTSTCSAGYSNSAISKCAKLGPGYARITYLGD